VANKGAKHKNGAKTGQVWIASRHTLKGASGKRSWVRPSESPPSTNRFLDLADIALREKEKVPKRRKNSIRNARE